MTTMPARSQTPVPTASAAEQRSAWQTARTHRSMPTIFQRQPAMLREMFPATAYAMEFWALPFPTAKPPAPLDPEITPWEFACRVKQKTVPVDRPIADSIFQFAMPEPLEHAMAPMPLPAKEHRPALQTVPAGAPVIISPPPLLAATAMPATEWKPAMPREVARLLPTAFPPRVLPPRSMEPLPIAST